MISEKIYAAAFGSVGLFLALFTLCLPNYKVSAGTSAKSRGAELFATKGCAHCHGAAGVGGNIGPDLQLVRKRMNSASIASQIRDGGKSMPAFGDSLSTVQIDDLVAYLREKRKIIPAPALPAPTRPASPASDPPRS